MRDWPDSEPLLERFRQWLSETHSEAEQTAGDQTPSLERDETASPASAAMADVAAAMTALRHEVKLETKSARFARPGRASFERVEPSHEPLRQRASR